MKLWNQDLQTLPQQPYVQKTVDSEIKVEIPAIWFHKHSSFRLLSLQTNQTITRTPTTCSERCLQITLNLTTNLQASLQWSRKLHMLLFNTCVTTITWWIYNYLGQVNDGHNTRCAKLQPSTIPLYLQLVRWWEWTDLLCSYNQVYTYRSVAVGQYQFTWSNFISDVR